MTFKKKQEQKTSDFVINTVDSIESNLKPFVREKLTKKFFMALKPGRYLISNMGLSPTKPIFAEIVEPDEWKMSQWERIVTSGANNRLCYVFENETDYAGYIAPTIERIVKTKIDELPLDNIG